MLRPADTGVNRGQVDGPQWRNRLLDMRARPSYLVPLALVSVLRCDQGLQPRPLATSISGTVTFAGAEPPGTENVFVVAFRRFPKTTADQIGRASCRERV